MTVAVTVTRQLTLSNVPKITKLEEYGLHTDSSDIFLVFLVFLFVLKLNAFTYSAW